MAGISPQISVLIHFLNAETYLSQAIESVLWQTFQDWELILVDGGSTDGSASIVQAYQQKFPQKIRALVHPGPETLGIFSSRMWGAEHAGAPILALLDSDDQWQPQFLERHYAIYQQVFAERPGMIYCPVVYWWEDRTFATKSYVQPVPTPGLHEPPNLLIPFVEHGYHKSAANSGVMIARESLIEAQSLIGIATEGMTDDQYLWSFLIFKIPVFISPEPLVRYRQWSGSTCAIGIQEGRSKQSRKVHLTWLIEYLMTQYSENIHNQLLEQLIHIFETEYPTSSLPKPAHLSLVQSKPSGIRKLKKRAQIFLHKILSKNVYISIRSGYRLIRQYAWVVFSQFERVMTFLRIIQIRVKVLMNVKPLSEQSGFDRGLPVHRYYLEQFLREFQFDIRGHCLEFQEDSYTSRFGQGLVTKLDILHHEEGNAQATIVADLTQPNALESESFDCIICTHVLHVVVRLETFAEELYRILKPGGVLLVAVPHISMCAPEWHELWRFTPEGVFSLLSTKFDSNNISLRSYGNSLTAAGKIRGMVTEDFTGKELGFHDPRFVVEVCARVRKEIKE